jgi:FMN-dependent NADH-azoreductase
MSKLLWIQGNPRGKQSGVDRRGEDLVSELRKKDPGLRVRIRNLYRQPLPHLSEDAVIAFATAEKSRNYTQREAVRLSDELTAELLEADFIIISTPLWGISIPSGLKAWIDHVVRVGKTYQVSETGLTEGLAVNKKAYFVGIGESSAFATDPTQTEAPSISFLTQVFKFLGVTNIQVLAETPSRTPASVA